MEPTTTNIVSVTGGNRQKILFYGAVGSVAVVLAAALMYFVASLSQKTSNQAAQQQLENVSAALDQAAVQTPTAPPSANPIKDLAPAENPIETTNPFKYEYQNPFK